LQINLFIEENNSVKPETALNDMFVSDLAGVQFIQVSLYLPVVC